MKGKNNILIAVLCMTAVMTSFLAVSPILSEISNSFPDASISQVQFVYTLGNLVALPIMLLAGKAANHIAKKKLAIFGLIVMLVGGLLPIPFHSQLWMLYISSSFLGFGMAFTNISAETILSDNFKGNSKSTVMGFNSAAFSIGGAALSWATGSIAAKAGWVNSYWVFLAMVPVIIIAIILLPMDEVVSAPETEKEDSKNTIYGSVIIFGLLNFVSCIFINAFNANIAMFLDESGLGGADVAGIAASVFMLIGIPIGLLLGIIMKFLRKNTVGLMSLCIAFGMLSIAFATNLFMVFLGTILCGIGFSVRTPANTTIASNMVPAASAGLGIAIVNSCGSLGNFASPIVVNIAGSFFRNRVQTKFLVCAAALVLLTVAYYIFTKTLKDDVA